jgi:tetratricopeptide (TPR) repeat protein
MKLLRILLLLSVHSFWMGLTGSSRTEVTPARQLLAEDQALPRVLGTAQNNQEFEDYQKVLATLDPKAVSQSAESFLQHYPNSGLSPFVHQAAMMAYQKLNDRDRLIRHGEAALRDLPDDVPVLATLAKTYAESDQPTQSIARATSALQAFGRTARPPGVADSVWRVERTKIEADIRLSLGTAYLTSAIKDHSGTREALLLNALKNLQESLDSDPELSAASYRLGLAYLAKNDRENAIRYLAWTSAIGGQLGTVARTKLEQVCTAQEKPSPLAIEDLLRKAREDFQKKVQEKQAAVQRAAP